MRANDEHLQIIAPGLLAQPCHEAEALGSAVWLWTHSRVHRNLPLHTLPTRLLPAIKLRQFVLVAEAGQPIFYLAWANFSAEAEARYVAQHPLLMPEADWNSGDRKWILDFVAPFGHAHAMARLVTRRLFPGHILHALDHRGVERGLKIKTYRGIAVMPDEFRHWLSTHPEPAVPAQPPAFPFPSQASTKDFA